MYGSMLSGVKQCTCNSLDSGAYHRDKPTHQARPHRSACTRWPEQTRPDRKACRYPDWAFCPSYNSARDFDLAYLAESWVEWCPSSQLPG